MPFVRKLLSDPSAEAAALRSKFGLWKVHSYCKLLWQTNKLRGRKDTFIGLLDTVSWTLYLSPCFGVTPDECQKQFGESANSYNVTLMRLRDRLTTKVEN